MELNIHLNYKCMAIAGDSDIWWVTQKTSGKIEANIALFESIKYDEYTNFWTEVEITILFEKPALKKGIKNEI